AAAATGPSSAAAQPASSPVKVRVGVQGVGGEIGLYLADARGFFSQEGLDVELVRLQGAPDLIPALATGELQLGGDATNPSLFSAARRDIGVKVISSVSIIPVDTRGGAALLVRQDHVDSGRFRDLSDLSGMNVALFTLGTAPQLYLE